MPRNRSEKRSPAEQEVLNYIKAWVAVSYDAAGLRTPEPYQSTDVGYRHFDKLPPEVRHAIKDVEHSGRREWLNAQKP